MSAVPDASSGLAALLEALAGGRTPDGVLESLVAHLTGPLGATGAAIHLHRHGVLVTRNRDGDVGRWGTTIGPGEEPPGEALAGDRTVLVETDGVAVLSCPLRHGDVVVGTLTASFPAPAPDRNLLEELAGVASVAIKMLGATEEALGRRRDLAALLRKVARVGAGGDVRPALQSLTEDAARLLGVARLVALERSPEGFAPAAGVGLPLDVLAADVLPPGALGIAPDPGAGPRAVEVAGADAPAVIDLVGGPPAGIALGSAAGEVNAAVVVRWPDGYVATEADLALVDAVAGLVAFGFAVSQADVRLDHGDLERTRDDFLATLSHELRTPLAVIKGAVETIQQHGDRLEPALFARLVDRIRHRVDQEVDMVETLLSLSRLDRGQYQLHREPFDLAALARHVAMDHMEASERIIAVDGPDEAPVVADRVAVRQVLSNLTGNALKFSQGDVVATIRRQPNRWRVEVDDDGEGIPPAVRERVFERFVQVGPDARRTGGVGVGLAVVRGFVELHGGQVGVGTSPTGGARFWFEIPDA